MTPKRPVSLFISAAATHLLLLTGMAAQAQSQQTYQFDVPGEPLGDALRVFGQASLQHAVRQYVIHYHTERTHQGLENRIPRPTSISALPRHPVRRQQRLGGLLSYYYRAAA